MLTPQSRFHGASWCGGWSRDRDVFGGCFFRRPASFEPRPHFCRVHRAACTRSRCARKARAVGFPMFTPSVIFSSRYYSRYRWLRLHDSHHASILSNVSLARTSFEFVLARCFGDPAFARPKLRSVPALGNDTALSLTMPPCSTADLSHAFCSLAHLLRLVCGLPDFAGRRRRAPRAGKGCWLSSFSALCLAEQTPSQQYRASFPSISRFPDRRPSRSLVHSSVEPISHRRHMLLARFARQLPGHKGRVFSVLLPSRLSRAVSAAAASVSFADRIFRIVQVKS